MASTKKRQTVSTPKAATTQVVVQSPYSFTSFIETVNNNFALILLAGVFFIAGFFIGSLWTENEIMKSGGGTAAQPSQVAADAAQPAAPPTITKEQLAKVPKVTNDDHARGANKPKVTLIEYSDFECPFCKRFHDTTQQILEKYGDKVRIVYRHYPLSFHPQAQKLAEASECVAKLGGTEAFYKFHDYVFESPDEVNSDTALDAVAAIGYSTSAVQTCLDKGEFTQKIKDQTAGGTTAGVRGTPGTILVTDDGEYEMISGALPFEQVEPTLQKYLN